MNKKSMNKLGVFTLISLALAALILSACAKPAVAPEPPKLFAAHNIWLHKNKANNLCINYKSGEERLLCGTAVKNVRIVRSAPGVDPGRSGEVFTYPRIYFTVVEDGRDLYIGFNSHWHPGMTIEQFKNAMFTEKPFEVLTEGMTKAEVDAIKAGVIVEGMSRPAVLCSYGPPPGHATSNLEDKEWMYWMTKFKKKRVCFGRDARTIPCPRRGGEDEL